MAGRGTRRLRRFISRPAKIRELPLAHLQSIAASRCPWPLPFHRGSFAARNSARRCFDSVSRETRSAKRGGVPRREQRRANTHRGKNEAACASVTEGPKVTRPPAEGRWETKKERRDGGLIS